jgi:hypothetical protein
MAVEAMLVKVPGGVPSGTPGLPETRQIQRRDWCPTAMTTSVDLAANTAGGQIHLPIVKYTTNSESPT